MEEIKFTEDTIAGVLKGAFLEVPWHQRAYSWMADKQVETLFDDLENALHLGDVYFLGTVVLVDGGIGTSSGNPQIIDGQQRLATVSILISEICNFLKHNGEQKRAAGFAQLYLHAENPFSESLSPTPRLLLSKDDREFYRTYVLSGETHIESRKPSHKLIAEARNMAKARVRQITDRFNEKVDKINALRKWVEFLQDRAKIALLRVPSHMNAYQMFETLNDRGLPTTQADLLKSYLFGQAEGKETEAEQLWSNAITRIESIGDEKQVTLSYLRHLAHVMYGSAKGDAVYATLKQNVEGPDEAIGFLREVDRYANDYHAILNPSHVKWSEYPDEMPFNIRELMDLRVGQIRPLFLAVAAHFEPEEATIAFKNFISWSLRVLISGSRGQRMEDNWSKAAHQVRKGALTTTKELLKQLDGVILTDAQFKQLFERMTVSKDPFARYLLRKLEQTASGVDRETDPSERTKILTLEHILPENIGPGWSLEREDHAAYWRRLGNLTLLAPKPNSRTGNKPYAERVEVYAQSNISLTKEIPKRWPVEQGWGLRQIDDRQIRLAELALKAWPRLSLK